MTKTTETKKVREQRFGVWRNGRLSYDFGFPKEHPSHFADFNPTTDAVILVDISYYAPESP